jgi:hypothetical protein
MNELFIDFGSAMTTLISQSMAQGFGSGNPG